MDLHLMTISGARDDTIELLETMLGDDFSIEVTNTNSVPHADEAGITFPNLDQGYQRCKLIETAVLYIDIRRSTELSLEHEPEVVAKLYSGFVRAMTRCAGEHNGHVRGIIGDRVMVLFNPATAFVDAVRTAILMNSVVQYVLNPYFNAGEIACGIGIDYGRMLATKTGIIRRGVEQSNYRSLVWLGRPANVASKLTDQANKESSSTRKFVKEHFHYPAIAQWGEMQTSLEEFIRKLRPYGTGVFLMPGENYLVAAEIQEEHSNVKYPPILMTDPVFQGYRRENPGAESVMNRWWRPKGVTVPGYSGRVWGGDVIYTAFRS